MVLLGGTYIPLIQQGYGTLIDVRTGDLVWFDFAQAESFGDTRNEKGAKDAGKLRTEGKDYVVKDGDIMHFLHNT